MSMNAPLVRIDPHSSESDSPHVQTPLSTDNSKKGDSIPIPLKTISIMPNDAPEATVISQPKGTIVQPIRYIDVNGITHNVKFYKFVFISFLPCGVCVLNAAQHA